MVADAMTRVDRISSHARQVDVMAVVARAMLTVVAALLWLVGAMPAVLIKVVVWSAMAVKVGYVEARGPSRGPRGGDGEQT